MQRKIPCVLMRGGTSRGPYFLASDLPADPGRRDAVLLSVMGSPHALQVDGIGGSNTLTSKVAIVSRSQREGADVDYLFAQVSVTEAFVDTKPNCGNMLAGVGPFAIETGLVRAENPTTKVRDRRDRRELRRHGDAGDDHGRRSLRQDRAGNSGRAG